MTENRWDELARCLRILDLEAATGHRDGGRGMSMRAHVRAAKAAAMGAHAEHAVTLWELEDLRDAVSRPHIAFRVAAAAVGGLVAFTAGVMVGGWVL